MSSSVISRVAKREDEIWTFVCSIVVLFLVKDTKESTILISDFDSDCTGSLVRVLGDERGQRMDEEVAVRGFRQDDSHDPTPSPCGDIVGHYNPPRAPFTD